jgi:CubicO group peptidase (beta-lactamase class C family)
VTAYLDGFLPYALERGNIAGAVVVVKDGQPPVEKGDGFSDIETRAPVDPRRTLGPRYRACSSPWPVWPRSGLHSACA